jgi:hypothetical protein
MPRVFQGTTKGIKAFANCCREEVGQVMMKVPSPEESQMPSMQSELSNQDKERIKEAHLSEATETLAKTMQNKTSGDRGVLKSVLVRQNPTSLTEAIQIAMQMEQKWTKVKLEKAIIQGLADMEDHDLQQCPDLEPQFIRQVHQQ